MRAASCRLIAGEALMLRPLEMADAPAWFEYACLPQVQEHTSANVASVDDQRAVAERAPAR